MHRSMNSYGDLSDMALKNVLALADGEDPEDPDPGEDDGGTGTLWEREDGDCKYTFTGKAGSKVHFTILGVPITLTIGIDGTATYVYGDGKTNCKSGGNEQCTARYCPPFSM